MKMFTFELLVHFVESLSIAHGDEKSLGKIFLAHQSQRLRVSL